MFILRFVMFPVLEIHHVSGLVRGADDGRLFFAANRLSSVMTMKRDWMKVPVVSTVDNRHILQLQSFVML